MKITKEVREWVIILFVFGGLYISGYHTEVIGFLQRGIVATGLLQPDTNESYGEVNSQLILEDMNGQRLLLSELEGKTLFINFWATWCPPCIAEMPDIHKLYADTKSQVSFLMISRDNDEEKAKKWIENKGYDFPIYFVRSALPQQLRSQSIPATFVISPEGEIVVKNTGMAKYHTKDFKNFLLSL